MLIWVDPVPRTGAANMAWDQTLLDLAEAEGRFVVRLYRWEPFCLSFGRNEPALRRYDRSRIEAMGLDVVRRPTGGRAVWHARELTYAVAAPGTALGTLAEAYRAIHEVLAGAVASLGAAATLATAPVRAAPVDAGACFASPAGGELLVIGSKVYPGREDRRKLFPDVTGLDMLPGEGVDIVHDLELPLDRKFAHIDCVSVLEHCRRPWVVAENICDSLVSRGTLLFDIC